MSKALEALREIKLNPNAKNNAYRFGLVEKELKRLEPIKAKLIDGIQGVYFECPICGNQVIKNHCCDNNECRQKFKW